MNQQLQLLRQLQGMDSELRECDIELSRSPDGLVRREEALSEGQRQLEQKVQDLKELRKTVDEKNLELEEEEGKIAKLRNQLTGIKTNREYAMMLEKIGDMEADKSLLEDGILELMMQQDNLAEECEALEGELSELEKEIQQLQEKLAEQRKEVEARAARIGSEREQVKQQVNAKFLQPYERLLAKQDGIALSSAHDQICHGCFMNLTTQTMALLMTSESPVFCHSCGRMLYLDEEEAERVAEPKGKKEK